MTTDLEEIYIAVLKRGCKINVIGKDVRQGKLNYFVEITEKDGITYIVILWENL